MKSLLKISVVLMGLILPAAAFAEEQQTAWAPNSGDTAWVLTSTALVLLMTIPALALFYGGMVRKKNVLSTIFYSFAAAIIVSLMWVAGQYSLIFSTGTEGTMGAFIGNMGKSFNGFLQIAGGHPNAGTIPESVFSMFQLMFAIITVALISGAVVERMSATGWLIFIFFWSLIVYTPLAHWVWNPEGWLFKKGALDFAGGLVVHTSSGVSALVAVLFLGQRVRFRKDPTEPANVAYVFIGAALLWVGWFGFNAGSAVSAGTWAGSAFVVTNTAAAAAGLSWWILEKIFTKKPSIIGACTGAVAGLVAITPASGFVDIYGALIIGFLVSAFSYTFMTVIRKKFKYDDALDVFSVHGLGGIWGAIATGLFANPDFNPVKAAGLFYGNPKQLMIQFISLGAAIGIAIVGTLISLFLANLFTRGKLRVEPQDEIYGLDLTQHGERVESR